MSRLRAAALRRAAAGPELGGRQKVHGQRGRLPQEPARVRQGQRAARVRGPRRKGVHLQPGLQRGQHPHQVRRGGRPVRLGHQHLQVLPHLPGARTRCRACPNCRARPADARGGRDVRRAPRAQMVAPKRAALAEANRKLDSASRKLAAIRARVRELQERVAVLEGGLMKARAARRAPPPGLRRRPPPPPGRDAALRRARAGDRGQERGHGAGGAHRRQGPPRRPPDQRPGRRVPALDGDHQAVHAGGGCARAAAPPTPSKPRRAARHARRARRQASWSATRCWRPRS